jgi:hypothetical protein
MASEMTFTGLRVLDDKTVELDFLTDEAETIHHRFSLAGAPIRVLESDDSWNSKYGRIPGIAIGRWPTELVFLALEGHGKPLLIREALEREQANVLGRAPIVPSQD